MKTTRSKHVLLVGGAGRWALAYWAEALVNALESGDIGQLTVVDFAQSPPEWVRCAKQRKPGTAMHYMCLSELLVPRQSEHRQFDVAIVSTPHEQHLSVCRELLVLDNCLIANNGELWIEKPLTPIMAEAEDFERFPPQCASPAKAEGNRSAM